MDPININFANKGPLLWLFWKGCKLNPSDIQEGYRSSHFVLGDVCAGHPRVGDDFLPLAVLVEPAGGCAKERGRQKLSRSSWSTSREFRPALALSSARTTHLRLQQVSPHEPTPIARHQPDLKHGNKYYRKQHSIFVPASVDPVSHEVVRLRGEQILD